MNGKNIPPPPRSFSWVIRYYFLLVSDLKDIDSKSVALLET